MTEKFPLERHVKATEKSTQKVVYDETYTLYAMSVDVTNDRFKIAAWTSIATKIGISTDLSGMDDYEIEFPTVE